MEPIIMDEDQIKEIMDKVGTTRSESLTNIRLIGKRE
jgi:hypothetical protein